MTALDSIEAPPRWRQANLVDGYCPGPGRHGRSLAKLKQQRQALVDRVADPASAQALAEIDDELAPRRGRARAGSPPAGLVYAGTIHNGGGRVPRDRPGRRQAAADPRAPPRRRQEPGRPRSARGRSSVLAELPARFDLSAGHTEGDRRAALARWLTDPQNPLDLAVDRQPRLAVPFRPRDRRHAQRLRPDGPAAHASRAARLAGGRVPRRRPVAQGAAPADRHVRHLPASVGRQRRRPRRSTRTTPTSGG